MVDSLSSVCDETRTPVSKSAESGCSVCASPVSMQHGPVPPPELSECRVCPRHQRSEAEWAHRSRSCARQSEEGSPPSHPGGLVIACAVFASPACLALRSASRGLCTRSPDEAE